MLTQNFRGSPSSCPRIALLVRWPGLNLARLLGTVWSSSGKGFDLAGDVLDKTTQLSSDAHADLVLRQLAPHAQMSEAVSQAQLGAPGDVAHGFGLPHSR
jgi:hypothetical protein